MTAPDPSGAFEVDGPFLGSVPNVVSERSRYAVEGLDEGEHSAEERIEEREDHEAYTADYGVGDQPKQRENEC